MIRTALMLYIQQKCSFFAIDDKYDKRLKNALNETISRLRFYTIHIIPYNCYLIDYFNKSQVLLARQQQQ